MNREREEVWLLSADERMQKQSNQECRKREKIRGESAEIYVNS
jgi:hypothetical protein